MIKYDYIIAGGGASGLSLAYYLTQSSLQNQRILVIDRDAKNANDRTWCFWTAETTALDSIVTCDWQNLHFFDDIGTVPLDLKSFHYKLIRGIDFYNFTKTAIAKFPNVEWLQAEIQTIQEDAESPYVLANGQQYRAEWIFNSAFDWQQWQAQAQGKLFITTFSRLDGGNKRACFRPASCPFYGFSDETTRRCPIFLCLTFF